MFLFTCCDPPWAHLWERAGKSNKTNRQIHYSNLANTDFFKKRPNALWQHRSGCNSGWKRKWKITENIPMWLLHCCCECLCISNGYITGSQSWKRSRSCSRCWLCPALWTLSNVSFRHRFSYSKNCPPLATSHITNHVGPHLHTFSHPQAYRPPSSTGMYRTHYSRNTYPGDKDRERDRTGDPAKIGKTEHGKRQGQEQRGDMPSCHQSSIKGEEGEKGRRSQHVESPGG